MMRAGKLRQRVKIERLSGEVNTYSEETESWRGIGYARASIEPISGKEYLTRSGENEEVTTRIRVRYNPTTKKITARDRIVTDGGVAYDVISPPMSPQSRNREIILMCKSGGYGHGQ